MGSKVTKMSVLKSVGSMGVVATTVALTQGAAYLATLKPMWRPQILNYLGFYTIGVQWVSFIHAGGFFGNQRTEKYYDFIGSLTHISTVAVSYFLLPTKSIRQSIVSAASTIWALRLGVFLFWRIHQSGSDSRFTEMKKDNWQFLIAWTLQGAWVFLTQLSILTLNQAEDKNRLKIVNYVGLSIWVIGFIIEVVSDLQKSAFKMNPENRGKFIDTGLWSTSRHPNYFGKRSKTQNFILFILTPN